MHSVAYGTTFCLCVGARPPRADDGDEQYMLEYVAGGSFTVLEFTELTMV